MTKTHKKTRAQQRNDSERQIWEALVGYGNDGSRFKELVGLGLDWISGDFDEIEDCRDMRGGATLESLGIRYREGIRDILLWLSAPEKDQYAGRACQLLHRANDIRMSWLPADYKPQDRDATLISEWPDEIGSVLAPICRFVKEQIDRHDLDGERLRDVIPIGMCDRVGCGKFRLIKLFRPGHFFCSNLCKASFHQANKTKEEKKQYMRKHRKVQNRNKPENVPRIGKRGRSKKTKGKRR
jgi:hypothetical protein